MYTGSHNSMAKPFKRGDIVRLKSGGPPMTIRDASDNDSEVICQWFTKSGVLQANSFETILLEEVGKEGPTQVVVEFVTTEQR